MKRLIWIDGRFSWPFVSSVILVTLLLLATDLIWRLFVLPLETLLFIAVTSAVVLAVLVGLVSFALRRK